MARGRALRICALGLATAIVVAAPARAEFKPCPDLTGIQCTRVSVPLDRSGALGGTISLDVARVPARHRSRRAILVLQGGPGGAGRSLVAALRDTFNPALEDRDLIGLDPRGTGRSGLLRCPASERVTSVQGEAPAAAECAARLGPARSFYTTEDTVADIEALRAALGIDTLAIYGVSYGTKTAMVYAARHPDRVDHLVLDSTLPLDGPDAFNAANLRAAPRVLAAVCGGRRCRRVTPNPAGDLRAVAARLALSHIHGGVIDSRGRRRSVRVTGGQLVQLLVSGEPFDEGLRARLPMALRSANLGDPAPILRLARDVARANSPARPEDVSAGVFASTLCGEARLPWARSTTAADRPARARAAVRALRPGALGPFAPGAALAGSDTVELCRLWPEVTRTAAPLPPLPDVPVLLLAGELDLRTPVEDARRVAAAFPRAAVLRVPGTGHGALRGDPSGCAERAVGMFLRGAAVSTCRRGPGPAVAPFLPRSLSQVRRPRGVPGPRGRVAAAAIMTITDVLDQVEQAVADEEGGGRHHSSYGGGGLRAGRWRLDGDRLRIRGVVLVRGVRVSAVFDDRFDPTGTLHVDGPGRLDGKLALSSDEGRATGRVGGRPVRVRLSATAFSGPAPRAAAAAVRLRHIAAGLRRGWG
ncbi:MAG: alpha/beta hydrolase [Actinomycetota bacterium]|nr:alpha/beta hydrolase [Actinomycetota bacterium]